PEAERPAARCRAARRQQHPGCAHRRPAAGLRSHRAARARAPGPVVLQGRLRIGGAPALRSAAAQHRPRSRLQLHHQSGQHYLERRDRRRGLAVRAPAGARRHGLHGDRSRRPLPPRQRPRHQRHLRAGCAQRDHRRPERHARRRVRRQALVLHARGAWGALERALDRVAALGRDVPLGREVSDPVRIAVVGAGAIAQVAHLPSLRRLPGVERVLQASEKYGKRVMVGMNHRFRSDVQAVRGFLAGGDIGQLQAIRGGWYTFQPSRQLIGWRLRRQEAGGGAFLDLGLQLLDLGLWLAGWPAAKRVAAHTIGPSKDGVEDMATALVVCENGVSLSIDVSWRHMGEAERFWFDLVGTKGSASVQPLRIFKEIHGNVSDVTPTGASGRETAFAQSYRAEWTYFLAVIKGDVNAPPPRDQLALHRVLEAVYRSADEGRDVLL